MYSKFLIIFASAIVAVSCFKDETFDTQYYMESVEQLYSGEDDYSLEGVLLYAYAGERDDWGALSYADATQGIVYDFESGELLDIVASSTIDPADPSQVIIRLQRESVMLLAVDTKNQIFATRNYTVGLNLSSTYVFMRWRPWKDASYTENNWYYDHSEVKLSEEVVDEESQTEE